MDFMIVQHRAHYGVGEPHTMLPQMLPHAELRRSEG